MAITLIAGAAVVGAGASVASGISASKAAKKAAAAQKASASNQYNFNMEQLAWMKEQAGAYDERVGELIGESRATVEDAYSRILGIIGNIPKVGSLMPEAEGLSRRDFDFRTGIKRENLDFILGNTGDELRETQQFNADLANLEENAFTNRFNKIIRSNMAGLKASTIGEPVGTFANLSAQNLYNFSQQGLSNYLAINDFFSREGTVDPISPYTIAQDLFTNEFNKAGLSINNEQWRAGTLVDINSAAMGAAGNSYNNAIGISQLAMDANARYSEGLAGSEMASAAASNLQWQGIMQGIGQLTQGFTSAYGLQMQQQALNQQQTFQQGLLSQYGLNSLGSYAPSRSTTSTPVSSGVSYGTTAKPTSVVPLTTRPDYLYDLPTMMPNTGGSSSLFGAN